MKEKLERLAAARIQIVPVPGQGSHFLLERDGFVALVRGTAEGLGQPGAAGLLTQSGFAALVWRGGAPFFVARGFELPAEGTQVDALRQFEADLRAALAC